MADQQLSRTAQELQSIPFKTLIGAPLTAVIDAQSEAARTTVNFIQQVGFEQTSGSNGSSHFGNTRNVSFTYQKLDKDGKNSNANLTVPLLTIVPIPFIRVESTDIEFTAKITDMLSSSDSNSDKAEVSAGVSGGWGPIQAEFRASYSHDSSRSNESKYSAEYTMNVKVHAVQDDMPAGLKKMLMILEHAITDQPATTSSSGSGSGVA